MKKRMIAAMLCLMMTVTAIHPTAVMADEEQQQESMDASENDSESSFIYNEQEETLVEEIIEEADSCEADIPASTDDADRAVCGEEDCSPGDPEAEAADSVIELKYTGNLIRISENEDGTYTYGTYTNDNRVTEITGGSKCRISGSPSYPAYGIYVDSGSVEMTIADLGISCPYNSSSCISVKAGAELSLNLEGDNKVTVYDSDSYYEPAIYVPEGAYLKISGTGSLTAKGMTGIGGRNGEKSGTIRILGGDITATGVDGAGIGGGRRGENGSVIISGGKVTATSWSGAGIGGGCAGAGGTIRISGGDVTARSTQSGAGIGCGSKGGSGGEITITGGTVSASSKLEAGIGGGDFSNSGRITIAGGSVYAASEGFSAGIGGGYHGSGKTINITGGNVTAISAKCAAVGGGCDSSGGTVTIGEDAELTAEGWGNAIGGDGTDNEYGCDAISIDERAVCHLSNTRNNTVNCIEKITAVHPKNMTGKTGDSTELTVEGSYGFSGLSYQWQSSSDGQSWEDLAGKNEAVCSVTIDEENDGAYYRCKLTNGWGSSICTNPARAFSIQQPESAELIEADDSALLNAAAKISDASYQWEINTDSGENWAELPGETESELHVSRGACDSVSFYRCRITLKQGDVFYSEPACVSVLHKEMIDPASESTCTENGTTEGAHCSVCGKILIKQEVIEAPGHKWNEWTVTKNATLHDTGSRFRKCMVCDTEETEQLPMLTLPFTDVNSSSSFADAILWASEQGITGGRTATLFDPHGSCTRAQVVTFLWRAAGKPEPVSKKNPFRDVSSGAYYYKAVLWANEQGITGGKTAETFVPNDCCTRAQVVTFLWRAAGKPEPISAENRFKDVSGGTYYYKAVLWAVENGITLGNTSTQFLPNADCTRAQVVTFMYRAK